MPLSLGGLASAWALLQRPDAFGGALLVSPSLWFAPPDADAPAVRGGWITQQFAASRPGSGRVYLAVGSLETGPFPDSFPGVHGLSMVELARDFRDVVTAGGLELAGYREQPGGHNFVTAQRVLVPGLAGLLAVGPAMSS
ncbi:alpha/beta hydrolase-fold protein [Pseudonocardia sp. GCM10023141]|uniref:alpha/beta hydrolase-fold protein n=1 Tax=Pseudonocardia sp. GCM10023141 TaxID=3252653 RepID=UPI003610B1B2